MRKAIILDGAEPVNVIVIPEGADGDAMLSGTCVEITHLDPKPGLGNGWTYVDGVFVPPPAPPLTWDDIRAERNRLLAECDWTQMPDSPLDADSKQEWADYRQALRDIPLTQDDPNNIVWPDAP